MVGPHGSLTHEAANNERDITIPKRRDVHGYHGDNRQPTEHTDTGPQRREDIPHFLGQTFSVAQKMSYNSRKEMPARMGNIAIEKAVNVHLPAVYIMKP
jgi:hypothetical protein